MEALEKRPWRLPSDIRRSYYLPSLACIMLYLLAGLHGAAAQVKALFGQTNLGETLDCKATYYTTTFGAGACTFAQSSAQYSPWVSGTNSLVAINSAQYFGSQSCGLCLTYKGLGSGDGEDPVPKTPQYGIVADLCPECNSGDLDLATDGDGRWDIAWEPLQCAVGNSTFVYSFQGSNFYYLKILVANARVPVLSMSIYYNNSYRDMQRVSDNHFIFNAEGGLVVSLPTRIALTSVLGDTVYDTLATSMPSGNVPGRAQFPLSPKWGTVGSKYPVVVKPPAPPALKPPPPPPKPPPAPRATARPPPVPLAAPRPPPPWRSPPPVRQASVPAPPKPPQAPKPPPPPPRGPVNSSVLSALSTALQNVSSAQQSLKKIPFIDKVGKQVQTGLPIKPYLQCGGLGAKCYGSDCKEKPFAGTFCDGDSSGQDFNCTQLNSYFFQNRVVLAQTGPRECLPADQAKIQNSALANATKAVASAPQGAAESAPPCPIPVADGMQCGGSAGFCSSTNPAAACEDSSWRDACCTGEGSICRKFDSSYWECRNSPFEM